MINEGTERGKYEETEDNILKELKYFQSFLYHYFKDTPYNEHFNFIATTSKFF